MEYYELFQTMQRERNEKQERLAECMGELLSVKEQLKQLQSTVIFQRELLGEKTRLIEALNNYTDGLESICPVDHGQRRPK